MSKSCLEYLRQPHRIAYIPNWETGCWEWQGQKYPNGYGTRFYKGKRTTAHRHYYEELVGPIPKGKEIDHLCRNRACVNPAHLEAVTRVENMRRSMAIPVNHARTIKTTGQERADAAKAVLSGEPLAEVALRLGVGAQNVERWIRSRGFVYRPLPEGSFTGDYNRRHCA